MAQTSHAADAALARLAAGAIILYCPVAEKDRGIMRTRLATLCSGRVHYAWVVTAVMFTATLAGVGVRAAPGVMIVPADRCGPRNKSS